MAWKRVESDDEVIDRINFDTLLYGMFDKKRLLDIIKNFILFTSKGKIMAVYH